LRQGKTALLQSPGPIGYCNIFTNRGDRTSGEHRIRCYTQGFKSIKGLKD